MPILMASAPMSSSTERICPTTNSTGTGCTPVTPTVFSSTTATMAEVPKHPQAEKAFRSAWMPAPPLGSLPAMVRARL